MVYNLGIHDCDTEVGYMHVWHEEQASLGAQEIGSCIWHYLMHADNGKTDCLVRQLWWPEQKYKNEPNTFELMCQPKIKISTITQKIMESGHSFLPNDADFSDIEKRLKYHRSIYVPEQSYDVIREARSGTKPFVVITMADNDFVSCASLEKNITNRKTTVDGEKVN